MAKAKRAKSSILRGGGTRFSVFNSGLEVWLYDDANRDSIRRADPNCGSGGMPGGFDQLTRKGQIVGYRLMQDGELDIEIHVGDPLVGSELAVARWLEPQLAFLQLPSGRLCVESKAEKGAVVEVPSGDYCVTLYRIDREALDRDGISWSGPQEVVVLTAGGTAADAAIGLLPFQPRE